MSKMSELYIKMMEEFYNNHPEELQHMQNI